MTIAHPVDEMLTAQDLVAILAPVLRALFPRIEGAVSAGVRLYFMAEEMPKGRHAAVITELARQMVG